jgi:hypothetical protein
MKYRLPLLLWLTLAVGSGIAFAAGAMRISKPAVKDEIVGVIEAQLTAFRAGETEKAYRYASETMRQQTPLRAFVRLIQTNYPEIWQSTRAEFGVVRDDGDHATVIVHVYRKESDAPYDYVLFKESAGWRIRGVLRHESSRGTAI